MNWKEIDLDTGQFLSTFHLFQSSTPPQFFPSSQETKVWTRLADFVTKKWDDNWKENSFSKLFHNIHPYQSSTFFLGFVTVGEVTTNLYFTFFIKNVFHFIGNPLLIHSRVVQTKIKSVQVLVSVTFCYFLNPGFKNGIVYYLIHCEKKSSNCNSRVD